MSSFDYKPLYSCSSSVFVDGALTASRAQARQSVQDMFSRPGSLVQQGGANDQNDAEENDHDKPVVKIAKSHLLALQRMSGDISRATCDLRRAWLKFDELLRRYANDETVASESRCTYVELCQGQTMRCRSFGGLYDALALDVQQALSDGVNGVQVRVLQKRCDDLEDARDALEEDLKSLTNFLALRRAFVFDDGCWMGCERHMQTA